mmetsp:Transcript_26857/g.88129  ORF Transcript_26857/g.88129 Transcript_26857/m.88129 type:complete len:623 (-) Transcript_26857:349-2217(-)
MDRRPKAARGERLLHRIVLLSHERSVDAEPQRQNAQAEELFIVGQDGQRLLHQDYGVTQLQLLRLHPVDLVLETERGVPQQHLEHGVHLLPERDDDGDDAEDGDARPQHQALALRDEHVKEVDGVHRTERQHEHVAGEAVHEQGVERHEDWDAQGWEGALADDADEQTPENDSHREREQANLCAPHKHCDLDHDFAVELPERVDAHHLVETVRHLQRAPRNCCNDEGSFRVRWVQLEPDNLTKGERSLEHVVVDVHNLAQGGDQDGKVNDGVVRAAVRIANHHPAFYLGIRVAVQIHGDDLAHHGDAARHGSRKASTKDCPPLRHDESSPLSFVHNIARRGPGVKLCDAHFLVVGCPRSFMPLAFRCFGGNNVRFSVPARRHVGKRLDGEALEERRVLERLHLRRLVRFDRQQKARHRRHLLHRQQLCRPRPLQKFVAHRIQKLLERDLPVVVGVHPLHPIHNLSVVRVETLELQHCRKLVRVNRARPVCVDSCESFPNLEETCRVDILESSDWLSEDVRKAILCHPSLNVQPAEHVMEVSRHNFVLHLQRLEHNSNLLPRERTVIIEIDEVEARHHVVDACVPKLGVDERAEKIDKVHAPWEFLRELLHDEVYLLQRQAHH